MATTNTRSKNNSSGVATRWTPWGERAVTGRPDSGTGQLVGLSGTMTIKIVDGKHFYEFEYVL